LEVIVLELLPISMSPPPTFKFNLDALPPDLACIFVEFIPILAALSAPICISPVPSAVVKLELSAIFNSKGTEGLVEPIAKF